MPSPSAIAPGTSPQPAQGVRAKAPARPPGEEAPDAGQGGFAALLGMLGDAVPLPAPALAPATPPLPGAADTTDAAAAPAWNWNAATPLGQGLQGLSDLPGQAAAALPWGGQPSPFSGLLPPQLRRAGALVAETARMDSNALESGEWSDPAQRKAGIGGSAARSGTAAGTAPSAAAALALAAQGRGARAVAANAAAAPGQNTAYGAAPVASVQTPAETTAMPARLEGAAGLAAMLRSALDAPTLPAPALAALAPAAVQTGSDSAAGGRSAGQGTGAGTDGFQPAAQAQADSAPTMPGSEAGAPLPENASTPDAITEQMAYWATDHLQNAELTLAHDGQPVEVHVSLDGQQAHVAFRSDQSETRALLDAGTGQLRDLLGQEGLVLSGMSVGSSSSRAQSDAPPRPAPGRSAARQAAVAIEGETTAATRPPARASVPSERKVDLFV